MNRSFPTKAQAAVTVNYALYSSLITLFLYWNLTRETGVTFFILLLQTLPLLALLPGMIKKAYRAYSWLCFVLLFYFIFAVQRVFLSTSQVSDYIFLTLIVFLFVSSMMSSRWLQRIQKGLQ